MAWIEESTCNLCHFVHFQRAVNGKNCVPTFTGVDKVSAIVFCIIATCISHTHPTLNVNKMAAETELREMVTPH